jgi:hypothetical protein
MLSYIINDDYYKIFFIQYLILRLKKLGVYRHKSIIPEFLFHDIFVLLIRLIF